jgi:hypothetical protein
VEIDLLRRRDEVAAAEVEQATRLELVTSGRSVTIGLFVCGH